MSRIHRDDYKRKRKRKNKGELAINIRLRRFGKVPPTRDETLAALQFILDHHRTPARWQFAGIDWQNPKKASRGWEEGEIKDFEQFRPVIQKMLDSGGVRIGRPRHGDTSE